MNTKLLLATLIAVAPLADREPIEGHSISLELTTSDEPVKLKMVFKFAGDQMRLEPTVEQPGGAPPGDMLTGAYMLALPAGKVALIMPQMQMVSRMNAGEMFQPEPDEQKCDKVAVEDLGVGEPILGHATRKFRMRINLLAKGPLPAGEKVVEISVATDMPESNGTFKRFAKAFGNQVGSGECPDEFNKMPEGFPLRMRSTSPREKGPRTENMDVTAVTKMTFADGDFTLPAGMRIVDGK